MTDAQEIEYLVRSCIKDPSSHGAQAMNLNSWQPKIDRLVLECKTFYRRMPAWLRLVLAPLEFVYRLVSVLRPCLWIMSGEEVRSGQELTIIYSGNDENRHFLTSLAFHSFTREEIIGKTWLWNISKVAQSTGHKDALIITEVPRSFRVFFTQPMSWYVPCWVHGELDLAHGPDPFVNSRSLRSDINKIKNTELTFEVTNDHAYCHDFYHSMHIPFITKAHGKNAVVVDYNLVKQELRRCDLAFIRKDEERLAGALIRYSNKQAELWLLGIKDGDLEHIKRGVIGALYYFPIQYLQAKGIRRLDLGPSRAFLRNGVLQYKKKWNQTIAKIYPVGFLIRPLSMGTAVKGFLCNNPFIFGDGTKLNGAIFTEADQLLAKDFFARIHKEYFLKGMSQLVVFTFGETNCEIQDVVPSAWSDRIAVRSVDTVLRDQRD